MRPAVVGCVGAAAVVAVIWTSLPALGQNRAPANERRMSFHNRLLLNRAVLAGLRSMEVLVLVRIDAGDGGEAALQHVAADVTTLGGRVVRTEPAIGYLRIELPPERLLDLADSPLIDAYQISSFSLGTWYRDGPPLANATMQRGFEVTPIAAMEPTGSSSHLPELTHEASRASGLTADDDAGVGPWMRAHPTFDGRGVTIALVESGLPSFSDPVLRTAMTLDGREVPKVAGILNAIDPSSDDETRVRLDTVIDAAKPWCRLGNRTYILPRPGRYRAGMLEVPAGTNLVHRFAVIEHQQTREVWIDSNGDASLQDETPLPDVNERFDPRMLTLSSPRKTAVSFVMSRAAEPHVVHIYLGKSGHQTMTASVAAGNLTRQSLASGVAPNARLLFVRISSPNAGGLGRMVEGFILAAQRPDVDVVCASTGLATVPDTAGDFVAALFTRLHLVYRKPILNAAGNNGLNIGSVQGNGSLLAVGGMQGAATFDALYGGGSIAGPIVHVMSAAGPSLDGAVKPDFLAPTERIAADLPWASELDSTPQNAPTTRLPAGYRISCCTSASSPYAAGVMALLISGARQSNVKYSAETLNRALKITARVLPGFQAHQQGNGVLDIGAAWRELAGPVEPPRIVASATIVHPLAHYAARGTDGQGILEFEGWRAGMTRTREIRLRRESGSKKPLTYRLTWSADAGTFSTPRTVTLPLNETVAVPVTIAISAPGAYSGLFTVEDAMTGAIVFRTQATVVATHTFDPDTGALEIADKAGLMRANAHYLEVPPRTGALALELEVKRGVVTPTILQAHGLFPAYYLHAHPMDVFTAGPGRYRIIMPDPEPGTWTVRVKNSSLLFPPRHRLGPRDASDAEYTLRARVLASSVEVTTADAAAVAVDVRNTGSSITEALIEAWPASLRTHRERFAANGLSNLVEIDVPAEAAALSLQLRANVKSDLFLYDCTTGQCFSYDIAFPAATTQVLLVRKPAAGRWVAAVNAVPFPRSAGSFVLDEVITAGTPVRKTSTPGRRSGARWREVFDALPAPLTLGGRTPVVFFELHDSAAERGEIEHPWTTAPNFVKQRDRPVAIGTGIYKR